MLDSGATGSIVSLAFAEEIGLRSDSPGVLPASCSGGIGAGISRNWVARFDSIAIGNENIRDPQLRIVDYTTDMAHARGTPPDMFLGTDFLKTHRVYVARSQDKVYFSYTGGLVFPAVPSVECDERLAGKSPGEAMAIYDGVIAANPNDAKALVQRASLRLRGKDAPAALADLDAAIRIEPANGVALAMRASARAQVKNFEGAFADTEAAIANGIRSAQIYANRGGIRRAQGDCERALVEYDEALKLDPLHRGALRGREACSGGADAKKGA